MNKITRRTMLKSGVATIMLPLLDANVSAAVKTSSQTTIPKRLAFLTMGFGVAKADWFPDVKQVGSEYELPNSLKPFKDLKSDFSVLQNLSNKHNVNAHAGTTNLLTCAKTNATPGLFTNTVSCDQLGAEVLGKDTRHTSMAIGYSDGSDGHGGGIGYASWGRNGKPVGTYRKLIDLYGALFGAGGENVAQLRARLTRKESSLDALVQNAKRLNNHISKEDRSRVDEYFTSIRSIENRLSKAQDWADKPYPKAPFPKPGELKGKKEIQLILDMMHLAIQSDSTRVMTYMLPSGGILKDIGSSMNPHAMSHSGVARADRHADLQGRDLALSELVAGFLTKLKETKEYDGSSLLDHSLVAYGTRIRNGHTTNNGPMMLAGHGGGGLKQGQNLVYTENVTPLSNLWLSMIRHVGVKQDKFADSNAVLTEMGFS